MAWSRGQECTGGHDTIHGGAFASLCSPGVRRRYPLYDVQAFGRGVVRALSRGGIKGMTQRELEAAVYVFPVHVRGGVRF